MEKTNIPTYYLKEGQSWENFLLKNNVKIWENILNSINFCIENNIKKYKPFILKKDNGELTEFQFVVNEKNFEEVINKAITQLKESEEYELCSTANDLKNKVLKNNK